MLVLARQLNERIIIPVVRATIEVVALKPNAVRLGIDAPPEVAILREEVFRRAGGTSADLSRPADPDAEVRLSRIKHVLRNRLHSVALGMDLLSQPLRENPVPGLETMLQRMAEEVRTLDEQLRALLAEPLDRVVVHDAIGRPAPSRETAEGGLAS